MASRTGAKQSAKNDSRRSSRADRYLVRRTGDEGMKFVFLRASVMATLIATCVPSDTTADDWPHWRGVNRNSVVAESSGWDKGIWRLENSWDTNVGEGSSSPLVVAGRVYTMGWRSGRDHIGCLDVRTGKTLWSVSYECPRYGRVATGGLVSAAPGRGGCRCPPAPRSAVPGRPMAPERRRYLYPVPAHPRARRPAPVRC